MEVKSKVKSYATVNKLNFQSHAQIHHRSPPTFESSQNESQSQCVIAFHVSHKINLNIRHLSDCVRYYRWHLATLPNAGSGAKSAAS